MNEQNLIDKLTSIGVRVCGKSIVSPFRMRDSAGKMALINFAIEKCGYVLADERAFTPRLSDVEERA